MAVSKRILEVDHEKKYETVVNSGQAAGRALLTMNGGGTVAFLTFIGHLWDKGMMSSASFRLFGAALQCFIAGTFITVFAYGLIFLANCASFRGYLKTTNSMFVLTVLFGFVAMACFVAGSVRAIEAFQSVSSLPRP